MSDNMFPVVPEAVAIKRYMKASNGATVDHTPAVRCYRYSPDRVMLQIRGEKSFASVTLPFDVAKKVAAALVEECK